MTSVSVCVCYEISLSSLSLPTPLPAPRPMVCLRMDSGYVKRCSRGIFFNSGQMTSPYLVYSHCLSRWIQRIRRTG